MADREPDPTAWGIEPGYEASGGTWRRTPSETVAAILDAMHAQGNAPPPDSVLVSSARNRPRLPQPAWVELEEGGVFCCRGSLPPDLPAGYHRMAPTPDGPWQPLIVTPPRCHLPEALRGWLLAVQLYALRSSGSWGIGDLGDVRALARWTRAQGGTSILLNPLHAPAPAHPLEVSPYYPSSRVYRNPLYLDVGAVPGAERLGAELEPLARAGRDLNARRWIDRDRVWDLKRAVLQQIFEAAGSAQPPAFSAWRQAEGDALRSFATYCAIAERHGAAWRRWPPGWRRPDAPDVRAFERGHEAEISFHAWLQWQLAQQLTALGSEMRPLTDLAVGVDPDGADAWRWQDVLALEASIGAPPDAFNEQGQNWGLPPFHPWRLRAVAYQPVREMLRAAFQGAYGVRLDHVMGLFRLFWIPPGADSRAGGYVRYPADELLGIVALESQRAGGIVVGEDLGTVADGVREMLQQHGVLSYRLLLFEDRRPHDFPIDALAAVTTHDLPTLPGLWGRTDPASATLRHRLERVTGLGSSAPAGEVVLAASRALAASPCRLVAATLEDACDVTEPANRPGVRDRRNWSIALPVTVDEFCESPEAARLAAALHRPSPH